LKNAFYKMIGANSNDRKNSASTFRKVFELLKDSARRWSQDEAMLMSAALSYYTAFSIAPLLLLIISIAGLAFGREAAQGQIVNQLTGLLGPKSAEAIQSMIQAANQPLNGIVATLIGVITLIVGATGVLSELKKTLNKIWRIQEPDGVQAL